VLSKVIPSVQNGPSRAPLGRHVVHCRFPRDLDQLSVLRFSPPRDRSCTTFSTVTTTGSPIAGPNSVSFSPLLFLAGGRLSKGALLPAAHWTTDVTQTAPVPDGGLSVFSLVTKPHCKMVLWTERSSYLCYFNLGQSFPE